MADHEHVVAASIGDEGVGSAEVEHTRTWRNHFGLHHVFGGDCIEVAGDQRRRSGILAGDDVGIDGGADQEAIGVGALERRAASVAGSGGWQCSDGADDGERNAQAG